MTDELRPARIALLRAPRDEAPAPPTTAFARAALEPLEVAAPDDDEALAALGKALAGSCQALVLPGDGPIVQERARRLGVASGLPVVVAGQAARVRDAAAALAALNAAEARQKEDLDRPPEQQAPPRVALEDDAGRALAGLLRAAGVAADRIVDSAALPGPGRTPAVGVARPGAKAVAPDVAVTVGKARADAPAPAPRPAGKSDPQPRPDAEPRGPQHVAVGGDQGELVLPHLVRAAIDRPKVRSIGADPSASTSSVMALGAVAGKAPPGLSGPITTDPTLGVLDDEGVAAVAKALAALAPSGELPAADDPRLLPALAPAAAHALEEAGRKALKPSPNTTRTPPAPLEPDALAAYGRALLDLRSPLRRALRPAFAAARQAPRRLVFAHGDDPRVVSAARQLADEGLATPWLLGDLFRLETRAKEQGLSLKGIRVLDPLRDKRRGPYAQALAAAVGPRGVTPEDAARLVEEPVVFAACAVLQGEADAVILSDGRGEGLEPLGLAQELLGKREKVRSLAGAHLVALEERVLVVTDTLAWSDPTCEEVADAALQAAWLARTLLGLEPKVALVAFTTHGARHDPSVARLGLARDLLRVRDAGLKVDGPLALDVAVDAAAQQARLPSCPLEGPANVLVLADRTAGATLVHALTRFAGAETIGPLLGGLRQPLTVAPRGATVEELALLGVLTAAQLPAPAEAPEAERTRTPLPGETARPAATAALPRPEPASAAAPKPAATVEPPRPKVEAPKVEAPPPASKPAPAPAPKPAATIEPPKPAAAPPATGKVAKPDVGKGTLAQRPSDVGLGGKPEPGKPAR